MDAKRLEEIRALYAAVDADVMLMSPGQRFEALADCHSAVGELLAALDEARAQERARIRRQLLAAAEPKENSADHVLRYNDADIGRALRLEADALEDP